MAIYLVRLTELSWYEIEVDADSNDEAVECAYDCYRDSTNYLIDTEMTNVEVNQL